MSFELYIRCNITRFTHLRFLGGTHARQQCHDLRSHEHQTTISVIIANRNRLFWLLWSQMFATCTLKRDRLSEIRWIDRAPVFSPSYTGTALTSRLPLCTFSSYLAQLSLDFIEILRLVQNGALKRNPQIRRLSIRSLQACIFILA